ncbi:MAG: DUF6677 family protein [Verrucomicrobiota bacterium]
MSEESSKPNPGYLDEAESDTPAARNEKPGKRRLLPIALSAFVLPGAGQIAQKRPAVGVFYIVCILSSFVLLMTEIMRPLVHNWQYIFGTRFDEPAKIDWGRIGLGLLYFIAVYLVNLLDVWMAEKRRARKA